MKTTLMLIALLVGSLFAAGFVASHEELVALEADTSLTADAANAVTSLDVTSGISASEIEAEAALEADIEKDKSYRAYPAQVIWGNGWATKGSSGHLTQIALVKKVLVKQNDLSTQVTVTRGVLHVSKVGNFRLQSRTSADADDAASSMVFDVYGPKRDRDGVAGTLTLQRSNDLDGEFNIWKGTLKLSNGNTYDLQLATDQKPFRKASDARKAASASADVASDDGEVKAVAYGEASAQADVAKPRWRHFFDRIFKARAGSNSGSG